jgi:hypothetical protein
MAAEAATRGAAAAEEDAPAGVGAPITAACALTGEAVLFPPQQPALVLLLRHYA